ncbi:MAG: hypothetical protein ACFFFK_03090 [Candidatus Thorarchaeota archaeon]
MKLTKDAFSRAEEFIHSNARKLDIELFEYHFKEKSKDDVLGELKKYQNSDGGFGNAIESDFRLTASSAMATSVGLQYAVKVNAEANDEIVQRAIDYLVDTFDMEHSYWPRTPIEVNDVPHAPWWHVDEIKLPTEEYWANPSAELLGYLYRFQNNVPKDLFTQINKRALDNLSNLDIIESLYCFMNWERAYQSVPEPLKSIIHEKTSNTLRSFIQKPETLGEIRIFWIAPSRKSFFLVLPGFVYWFYDYEIGQQREDGGWWPTWSWGQYDDVWPIAEKEWAGKITVQCLLALDRFKLLEMS